MDVENLITIVIPSYNQGQYLEQALESVFTQNLSVEVFVMDGGSTDNSVEIIKKWAAKLAGWRSHKDSGQSAAINEGISLGSAPYVCWLNSDDYLLPDKLVKLLDILEGNPQVPMAYGRVDNVIDLMGKSHAVRVEPFSQARLAKRCIISQPATLIRRKVWEDVGGLNQQLDMAMDYDLWWRIFKQYGELRFVDKLIAVNRIHDATKTQLQRVKHYREAMGVVKKYNGSIPIKWWLYQPYSVWFKSALSWLRSY